MDDLRRSLPQQIPVKAQRIVGFKFHNDSARRVQVFHESLGLWPFTHEELSELRIKPVLCRLVVQYGAGALVGNRFVRSNPGTGTRYTDRCPGKPSDSANPCPMLRRSQPKHAILGQIRHDNAKSFSPNVGPHENTFPLVSHQFCFKFFGQSAVT